jgi:hypothetical protein
LADVSTGKARLYDHDAAMGELAARLAALRARA